MHSKSQAPRLPDCQAPTHSGSQAPRLQGSGVSKLPGSGVSKLPGSQAPRLPGSQASRFPRIQAHRPHECTSNCLKIYFPLFLIFIILRFFTPTEQGYVMYNSFQKKPHSTLIMIHFYFHILVCISLSYFCIFLDLRTIWKKYQIIDSQSGNTLNLPFHVQ